MLTVVRDIAAAKSEALGVPPYDALMDPYDPGRGLAQVNALFDDLDTDRAARSDARSGVTILDGILAGRPRIFISDGRVQDVITRLIPSHTHHVVSAIARWTGTVKR